MLPKKLALPVFCSDPLSSVAYATEEILLALSLGGLAMFYLSWWVGAATVVLLPSWSIVRSRMWKAQVPFLALRHRVVTFDGRGSGSSDRPAGAAAYANAEYAADTIAVMDAVGADRAVLVGLSSGAAWAAQVAASSPPDRDPSIPGDMYLPPLQPARWKYCALR